MAGRQQPEFAWRTPSWHIVPPMSASRVVLATSGSATTASALPVASAAFSVRVGAIEGGPGVGAPAAAAASLPAAVVGRDGADGATVAAAGSLVVAVVGRERADRGTAASATSLAVAVVGRERADNGGIVDSALTCMM